MTARAIETAFLRHPTEPTAISKMVRGNIYVASDNFITPKHVTISSGDFFANKSKDIKHAIKIKDYISSHLNILYIISL